MRVADNHTMFSAYYCVWLMCRIRGSLARHVCVLVDGWFDHDTGLSVLCVCALRTLHLWKKRYQFVS